MEYDILIKNIYDFINKYENRINLVSIRDTVEGLSLLNRDNPLVNKYVIYRLKKILDSILLKVEEINELDKVLCVFSDETIEIDIDKSILTNRINILSDKINAIDKSIASNRNAVISLSLVISLLTGGAVGCFKGNKDACIEEKYPTRKEVFNVADRKITVRNNYEYLRKNDEEILIKEYRRIPVTNNIIYSTENILYREYLVNDMDYTYLIINHDYIIDNLSKYIDRGNIKILKEIDLVNNKDYYTSYYQIERIIQDRENMVEFKNFNRRNFMLVLTLFIEFIIYANILNINHELLFVSLYKKLNVLISEIDIKKEEVMELYMYQELCYYLYKNDLEFSSIIDNISDEYIEKNENSKKLTKVDK